ncbi:MAG: hypothetical protein AAB403_11215 [Planctomycetota bacterium]
MRSGNNIIRFQVTAPDGRCSDVWRVWNTGTDVYLAPRAKGGEFKISLHRSGKWRLAFTREHAKLMRELGTWDADRCVEALERPPEHATGFTRAVWMYFPDSELRMPRTLQQKPGPIVQVPGPPGGGIRNVNLIFSTPESRFTQTDPPLRASLGAEPLAFWSLPNGEKLWVIHFELAGSRGLDREAANFLAGVSRAKKLDNRCPLNLRDSSGRIMIAGTNDQGWFCVIDAALS